MNLLPPLVFCALAVCCGAAPPRQPASGPSPLLPLSCNSSYVLDIADFILQDINRDRKDGYVLSLNRVSDAREHRQEAGLGSLFYFTLDVLETGCHVLSRRSWKDCGVRILHESVYGQCKAVFYVNKARRIFYLPAYNCTLRLVSRSEISMMCPDCPSSSPYDLSDPRFLETATESLAKYNQKSPSKQYSLVKITKTSSQWVFGPAYFVEYLIKESPCTKSQASSCTLQPSNSEPVGICHGSLSEQDSEKSVSVTCEFFKSQVEEPQQKNTSPTNSSAKAVPKGSVQYLPDLDDKPDGSQGQDPVEAFPLQLDLTTNPQGEPLDVSFLFLEPMEEKPVVLPFPSKEQRSAECPGPAQKDNPLILPP
ncbi:fetuin-B isoform X2 [Hippopotamus amphibius kiboko]|uniref:fetuin-B isoform X2 n=1 Tax=Hippopotamus amphibius kiboko TaxID=575201 RepID=UPI002593C7CD|nr:fetuin-B isoform X2 [Hippopotamus amphibius kiboko]